MAETTSAADLRAVFDDLVRFETILWNTIDARLRRDCGVPLGSFNVMLIIGTTPSCRVYDIATALAVTVGGTSQAVDRIEKAGHCVRLPNPDDRRSSILKLTPAGQDLLTAAEPSSTKNWRPSCAPRYPPAHSANSARR